MKRLAIIALLLSLTGCSGVMLNATYSKLLDQTAALSRDTADRAKAGKLTPDQMTGALDAQATTWEQFRAASKGQTTTQP